MRARTIRKIIISFIFLEITLLGCNLNDPIYNDRGIVNPVNGTVFSTFDEAKISAECWLYSAHNKRLGQWLDNRQCVGLSRLLTKVPPYGKDIDGSLNGGIDYINNQAKLGTPLPTLGQIKDKVKPCDVLILTGNKYSSAGHTVVVFNVDLGKNTIYYLDQNFNGEGIAFRNLFIDENKDSAYVIQTQCADNKPIRYDSCQNPGGAIIGAPNTTTQPRIGITIEAATLSPTSNWNLNNQISQDFFLGKWQGEIHYRASGDCNVNDDAGKKAELEVTTTCSLYEGNLCLNETLLSPYLQIGYPYYSFNNNSICFRASHTSQCLFRIDQNTIQFTDNGQEDILRCGVFTRSSIMSKAQIGWNETIYLNYDSSVWDKFVYGASNNDGATINDLVNKEYGCVITTRFPLGHDITYKKSEYQKRIGSLDYEIEEYKTVPYNGDSIFLYYPSSSNESSHIWLDDRGGNCVQSLEDVLLTSETNIGSPFH